MSLKPFISKINLHKNWGFSPFFFNKNLVGNFISLIFVRQNLKNMGQQIMFTNITTVDGVYLGDEAVDNNDAHIVCTDSLGREHVIVMHPHLLITAYNMMMNAIVGEQENAE